MNNDALAFTEAQIAAAARALADNHAKVCNVDKDDKWKIYSEDFIGEARLALAAVAVAPAVPVPVDQDQARDAARYRWLRMQEWFDSDLCVLRDPKRVLTRGIGLGADCPSRGRLDAAIDAAMAAPSLQQGKEGAA